MTDGASSTDHERVVAALDELIAAHPPTSTAKTEFLGAQYDAGLAWVHFDEGFGGLGISPALQPEVDAALESAGAPSPHHNYVGVHQAAASVHHYAPDELRRRWLRPAFVNEEYWCQLFSEPGAGSDLASLSTAAVRDGDEWVVNGQKVWTSFAHLARWAILLARSDPNAPKHRGLTFFVVDMKSDGIDVRPLQTMEGNRHFNEVFLSDVRIPDRYRLGEVGQGWAASTFLLSSERAGVIDSAIAPLSWLQENVERHRARISAEPILRDRVARAYIENEVLRLLALRSKASPATDFSSPLRLARSLVDHLNGITVMDLMGANGMLGGEYDWVDRPGAEQNDHMRFLRTRASTISGGSAQIMRNLIGERLLGLPGEARVDKDVPWKETRRS